MQVVDYVDLIRGFQSGSISTLEFQRRFSDMLRNDRGYHGPAEKYLGEIRGVIESTDIAAGNTEAIRSFRSMIDSHLSSLLSLTEVESLHPTTGSEVVRALSSSSSEVRFWAASIADEFASEPELIAALRRTLLDDEPAIHGVAARALAKSGDVASLEQIEALLTRAIDRPFRFELWAIARLATIQGGEARQGAIEAIQRYIDQGGANQAHALHYLDELRRDRSE